MPRINTGLKTLILLILINLWALKEGSLKHSLCPLSNNIDNGVSPIADFTYCTQHKANTNPSIHLQKQPNISRSNHTHVVLDMHNRKSTKHSEEKMQQMCHMLCERFRIIYRHNLSVQQPRHPQRLAVPSLPSAERNYNPHHGNHEEKPVNIHHLT